MAVMWVLVLADIDDMTAVPRLPQPITPTFTAELAFEPNTIPGFEMVKAEAAISAFNFITLPALGLYFKRPQYPHL